MLSTYMLSLRQLAFAFIYTDACLYKRIVCMYIRILFYSRTVQQILTKLGIQALQSQRFFIVNF